jgi:hypothetical protein
MALLLCAAIGCQELHEASKYDPLLWRKPPSSGTERALASAPAAPRLPSQDAEPNLHYVSYAPSDATPTADRSSGAVTSLTATTSGPNEGSSSSPLGQNSRASNGKWSDSLVVRGQTPLRQVFASDRVILASIVIAAIIIPIAIYDARQPNPPLHFQ